MMNLKHILLFGIFIALFSCNTESTDNPEEETKDSTLLKKTIETDSEGEVYTTNFTYDGNKLTSVDYGDGWKNVYKYENDKLVREDQYAENELTSYLTLEYNTDNKIASFKEFFLEPSGLGERVYNHIFTYNSDNTLTVEVYLGDNISQTELSYTETLTYSGKNISKIDAFSDSLTNSYDNNNGAFKNVYLIEVINILSETEFGALIYGNTNNLVSQTYVDPYGTEVEAYDYTYNADDYPETATYTDSYEGNIQYQSTIEYFY